MSEFERFAPAKVNLSFRILGKREDGFHEIETLMVPISLSDRIALRQTDQPGILFRCSDTTLPVGDDNLVVKAAKAFYAALGEEPCVEIYLEKSIPHGAGLGGGSSDAATVLLVLNQQHNGVFEQAKLAEIAASFGSDIPFFIYRSAAICKGRGEIVEPIAFPHHARVLLIKPPFAVPTPWAYSRWKDSREVPSVSYGPQKMAWGELVNDLERPVFEKYLMLAEMKMWLLEQPEVDAALMSGSGSTMIAFLRNNAGLISLARRTKNRFGESIFTQEASI